VSKFRFKSEIIDPQIHIKWAMSNKLMEQSRANSIWCYLMSAVFYVSKIAISVSLRFLDDHDEGLVIDVAKLCFNNHVEQQFVLCIFHVNYCSSATNNLRYTHRETACTHCSFKKQKTSRCFKKICISCVSEHSSRKF